MMTRRTFLCWLTLGILSMPLAGEAEQAERVYRVAVILAGSPVSGISKNPFLNAFTERLRELGYVEGQNILFARLSAEGRAERHGDLVAEALRLNPDVLVTVSSLMALVAKRATTTIPIVMATSIGPVERGIVPSLARPGGNITGLTIDAGPEFEGKRLELLKQVAPKTVRVAYIGPRYIWEGQWGAAAREAARALRIDLVFVETAAPEDIRDALVTARRERLDALYACDCSATFAARLVIAEFAMEHRMPAVSAYRDATEAGGLISYGVNYLEQYRRAAVYVDKILKGAKPADLPIEQPTKFELVINMRTAKALGLTIPQSVLVRADEILQ